MITQQGICSNCLINNLHVHVHVHQTLSTNHNCVNCKAGKQIVDFSHNFCHRLQSCTCRGTKQFLQCRSFHIISTYSWTLCIRFWCTSCIFYFSLDVKVTLVKTKISMTLMVYELQFSHFVESIPNRFLASAIFIYNRYIILDFERG